MTTADPTLATLARLVAHERWTLTQVGPAEAPEGMLFLDDHDTERDRDGILWRWHADAGRWLPDPDDAATGGVLLSLVPVGVEAQQQRDGSWVLMSGGTLYRAPTLGRACVPAIAAAWSIA